MTKDNVIPIDRIGACVDNVMHTLQAKSVILCVEYQNGDLQTSYSADFNIVKFCEMTALANYHAIKYIKEQESNGIR